MTAATAPDLGDRFTLSDLLGAGSFGRVYRATDHRYRMEVALKLLSGFHSEALRLFKGEFRALAHVSHANLVTLYELHSHGEAWFYTMEHVPGTTLSRWAKSEPRSIDAVRAALLQVASGVVALHEAGLLHRDIKPSNVLISPTGRIAVSDFGHIGALDPTRGATDDRVIGTVAYSSPEVWLRAPIAPASDWFAFGVTMFQLLTGRLPFESVVQRMEQDGPAPSRFAEGIAPELDDLCLRLLRRAPAERPGADEVVAVLAGRTSTGTVWTATPARFLGRAAELDALAVALDRTRTSGSALHLIGGASGIGKTALVEEAARRASGLGALVLRGRCHPQDALSARGLDSVVDALGRYISRATAPRRATLVPSPEPELRRMFPTLGDVLSNVLERRGREGTNKEERQAALSALARIFARVAAEVPVFVVIDDLHWADEETGSALVSLLEGLRAVPGLLVVGTFRDDHAEGSACLGIVESAIGGATKHSLGPLGTDRARELVHSILGQSDDGRAEAVLEAAHGNPYLLGEFASHLRQSSVPPKFSTDDALVDRVVSARLERLSMSARRMLDVLTLAEFPLPTDVVIEAAALAAEDYLGDLTTLRAGRLVSPRLVDGKEMLEPYHGRVREAVARSIPPAARPALHRAIALAFVRSHADAREVIARHYFAAGEHLLAFEHARAAAIEARDSLAFGRCVTMLELALQTGAASPTEARDLKIELADVLANAGRGREAATVFLALVSLDPSSAHLHERRAAEQLLFGGHLTEGLEVLARVLGRVGLALPRSRITSVARVLWAQTFGPGRRLLNAPLADGAPDPSLFARIDATNAATLGLTMTDPLASAVMQAQHLEDALAAREPERLARAIGIHMVHSAGGFYEPERSERIAKLVEGLLQGAPAPQTVAEIALARAGAAWMEGRYAACLGDADAAIALLRRSSCVGMQWHIDTHHIMELEVLEAMGRWDDVAARLTPYLQDAREREDRFLEASLRSRFSPTLMLATDAPDAAKEEAALARRLWGHTEFDLVALYAAIRTSWCDLYAGDAERAKASMDATWKDMQRSLLVRVVFYRDMGAAARGASLLGFARASTGDTRTRAIRDVRRVVASLSATTSRVPRAHAAMLAAGALALEEREQAVVAYREAAEGFRALGAAHLAAACVWRAEGSVVPAVPAGLRLARPERAFAMLAP